MNLDLERGLRIEVKFRLILAPFVFCFYCFSFWLRFPSNRLQGISWELPGRSGMRFGVLWESLGMLLERIFPLQEDVLT